MSIVNIHIPEWLQKSVSMLVVLAVVAGAAWYMDRQIAQILNASDMHNQRLVDRLEAILTRIDERTEAISLKLAEVDAKHE
ncbi:MAG: hypothetical protein GDA52_02290 [Rhodobacteraceae bacterium]|nr:hypothetical protein [Paracoccaceae bacterium]